MVSARHEHGGVAVEGCFCEGGVFPFPLLLVGGDDGVVKSNVKGGYGFLFCREKYEDVREQKRPNIAQENTRNKKDQFNRTCEHKVIDLQFFFFQNTGSKC